MGENYDNRFRDHEFIKMWDRWRLAMDAWDKWLDKCEKFPDPWWNPDLELLDALARPIAEEYLRASMAYKEWIEACRNEELV